MSEITRYRLVRNNEVVISQADFFTGDGFTRQAGLTIGQLTSTLFASNVPQPWLLMDGTNVADAQVASGRIYWNEIGGAAGFYSVRWRPNICGYWRLVLSYATGTQIDAQDFDVVGMPASTTTGLRASFTNPWGGT